jgi:hypothetical protein
MAPSHQAYNFTGESGANEDAANWLAALETNIHSSMTNREKVNLFQSKLLRGSPARKWFNKLPDEGHRRWDLVKREFESSWCTTTTPPGPPSLIALISTDVTVSTSFPLAPNILSAPDTSMPSTSINFETFGELCDLNDILQFLDAVAATQVGKNLQLLWDCAFAQGRSVEQDYGEEMYLRGKAHGFREAEEAARPAALEEGRLSGEANEKWLWEAAGHNIDNLGCVGVRSPPTSEVGVQSETPHVTTVSSSTQTTLINVNAQTSTTSHLDTSVQALEPPSSPNRPQKTSAAPLDWAEDANTLPIIPPSPSPRQPRDLSVLRSSSSSPFSSLQHRSKRFSHYSHQSRRRHSHSHFNSFNSLHRTSFKPFQSHSHTQTHSHLNWESDPRLSDLSRSLKALGWIRAS